MLADGPIVLRATRGSGGNGITILRSSDDLDQLWPSRSDGIVSVARYIENAAPLATPAKPALLDQINCRYVPHVLAIQTDQPRVKVSWQVTGIRHDKFANANRTRVIVPKAAADQGKYIFPQGFGKPRSDTIGLERSPTK